MSIRIACFLLLSSVCMFGQTTFSTITGIATDSSGLAVPGVSIEATEAATGYRFSSKTNEAGVYTVKGLVPGSYSVRALQNGFKEWLQKEVQLFAQETRTIDIRLEVGAVADSVVVTASNSHIETESAQVTNTMSSQDLKDVPVSGRQLQSYLQFNPGVIATSNDRIRFGGSLNNQTQWTLDGTSSSNFRSNNYGSGLLGQAMVEGFAEVRVQIGNSPAEYSAVGGVSVISKSGTNTLHGAMLDFYSDSKWSALSPFSVVRGPTTISHSPGVSVGGPVYLPHIYNGHNKTFFYFTYETSRGSSPNRAINATVPLVPWRSGDFSAISTVIRDPFNNNAPFSGNRIPMSRLNPVSLQIQDRFFLNPNYGDVSVFSPQNYRVLVPSPFGVRYSINTRVDHQITQNQLLWGRFAVARSFDSQPDGSSNQLNTQGFYHRVLKEFAFAAGATSTFRANLVNEFRYNLSGDDSPLVGEQNGSELVQKFGLQGLAPNLPSDLTGVPTVSFSGLGLTGLAVQQYHAPNNATKSHEFQDQLSWFRGRHSIKIGVSFTTGYLHDLVASTSLFGNLSFSNRFTNYPYADFLLGIPTTASRAFPTQEIHLTRAVYSAFVSDSFKVSSRLTLELGMRYELMPNWTNSDATFAMFDPGSGKIVVPNGALSKVSSLFPASYVGITEAKNVGLPDTLLKTDKNNFGPRVGFAWRPMGKSVIRGGFGVYYDQTPTQITTNSVPFAISEPSYTNPSPNPTVILPQVFPAAGNGGVSTVSIPSPYRTDLRIPLSMQYSLTLEREAWKNGFRLSYLGTNSRQQWWSYNMNSPVPDTRLFVDKARPFPTYPAILYNTNGAGHQYHSLSAVVERRFANGLEYQGSFVWSRDIGDTDYRTAEDPFDRHRDRGPVLENPVRRATGFLIYDLPFGDGRRFMSHSNRILNGFLGGWQLTNLVSMASGMFLTPLWTGPDPTGTAFTSSRTPAQVTIRPNRVADGNLPVDQRSLKAWYNVSAFTAPTAGQFGTSGIGVIVGPGLFLIKSSMAKTVPIHERLRLRIQMDALNLLNHPNYAAPDMNISDGPSAGTITSLSTNNEGAGMRSIRVVVRLEW